jgi:hypothetical protein
MERVKHMSMVIITLQYPTLRGSVATVYQKEYILLYVNNEEGENGRDPKRSTEHGLSVTQFVEASSVIL